MPLGDKLGEDTVADLNQFVHSWLDDATRRVQELLGVLAGHRVRLKGEFVIEVEPKELNQK